MTIDSGITDSIISQTKCWVKTVVIDCNFCPFARREFEQETIRYVVSQSSKVETILESLINECDFLDSNTQIETTLLIVPEGLASFDAFLSCIDIAEQLLEQQSYIGVYQLASFHPEYCFSDSSQDDAANYTNRSPYPMLHILREASLEKVLNGGANTENIPTRNIEYAREKGIEVMKSKLNGCKHE